MTRAEMVDAMVRDIHVHARLCELRRLAAETASTYAELIAHRTPADAARHFFACGWLLEQLDEERERRSRGR